MLAFINLCRELKLSKVSLTLRLPRDWVHTKGGGPGNEARAGMAGVMGGGKERVASRQQVPGARDRVEGLVIVRLFHVTTPSGELAQEEFLGEACANPFSRANRKISKHQSSTAIGLGEIDPPLSCEGLAACNRWSDG